MISKMFKKAGHLLRPCIFTGVGQRGVRLTWLFFLILTKRLHDEKLFEAGGQKASVARPCNEADGMEPE